MLRHQVNPIYGVNSLICPVSRGRHRKPKWQQGVKWSICWNGFSAFKAPRPAIQPVDYSTAISSKARVEFFGDTGGKGWRGVDLARTSIEAPRLNGHGQRPCGGWFGEEQGPKGKGHTFESCRVRGGGRGPGVPGLWRARFLETTLKTAGVHGLKGPADG